MTNELNKINMMMSAAAKRGMLLIEKQEQIQKEKHKLEHEHEELRQRALSEVERMDAKKMTMKDIKATPSDDLIKHIMEVKESNDRMERMAERLESLFREIEGMAKEELSLLGQAKECTDFLQYAEAYKAAMILND
jgi:hypothetical protein